MTAQNEGVGTLLPAIAHADDDTFDGVVAGSDRPVLVVLWSPTCGHCKMLAPMLAGLFEEFGDRFTVVKVNVAESPEIVDRFEVMGTPTLLVVVDGEVTHRRTGVAPEPLLRKWLEKAVPHGPE
jgi:thioredoxin